MEWLRLPLGHQGVARPPHGAKGRRNHPKRMWRMQLCPAIGALQRRYCFKRHSCPMEVLRCFLGWSWKLCSNSLVPFVVLGDSIDCRRLVVFWPRWSGVVNNGFGTNRCKICSFVLGRLPLGVALPQVFFLSFFFFFFFNFLFLRKKNFLIFFK